MRLGRWMSLIPRFAPRRFKTTDFTGARDGRISSHNADLESPVQWQREPAFGSRTNSGRLVVVVAGENELIPAPLKECWGRSSWRD
jgi:hypothetical protein